MPLASLSWRIVVSRVGTSKLVAPMLWPRFSVVADFCISRWTAEVACPVPSQSVWPACWIDTPVRFSSSSFFNSGCAGCLGYLSGGAWGSAS